MVKLLETQPFAMTKVITVIIVGGGIAGLTCGIALAKSGVRVTILERVTEFTAVGAGIQLAPNAVRVLKDLGVLPAVYAEGAMKCCWSETLRYDDSRVLHRRPLDRCKELYGEDWL